MKLRRGFAAALRYARKCKRLTQEDFSNVSSRTYLSSLERAIKSPTLDKVEGISSILGVHPATLIIMATMRSERKALGQVVERIQSEIRNLESQVEGKL